MSRTQVVTVGSSGYGAPYQEALGSKYEYLSVSTPADVADVAWRDVFAVVFSGGADIDPNLYGEEAEADTHIDEWHDVLDDAVIAAIRRQPSIYKYGTCRGAQRLFCTYLGGKLKQDIPHHYGGHIADLVPFPTRNHIDAEGCSENVAGVGMMAINSIHHQAMRWETVTSAEYFSDMEDSEDYWDDEPPRRDPPTLLMTGDSEGQTAVEAWVCRSKRCMGFQYHPEWLDRSDTAYQWTQEAIKSLVNTLSYDDAQWGFPRPRPRHNF